MAEIRRFLRIAHRGASGTCPENTRAAFLRAIELGADMIELDCQLTADGSVIVFHDDELDRTTNGSGLVTEKTLPQLKALDAGSWFDKRFAGEELLTLEEALDVIGDRASVNVELKGDTQGKLELLCLGIVTEAGAKERAVFSSFSRRSVAKIREIADEARVAVLMEAGEAWAEAIQFASEVGAEALHPEKSLVDGATLDHAQGRGFGVRAWPVNDRDELAHLVGLGIDGIFTDYPDRLLRIVV